MDGIHSFEETSLVNFLTFIVLSVSSAFALLEALQFGSFWWMLVIGFVLGAFYFLLLIRKTITYAITKFRIIRIENDLISKWFYRSSRLSGFTDLHYEHVESINVGPGKIPMPRLYISLISISIGWIILDVEILEQGGIDFFNLLAILMIVAGAINVVFSLPLGGVRLIVQSISGELMEFPETKTPASFIDNLIFNCRTFLSYGAK